MNKEHRRLPDSELEIMQVIWSCDGPVSRSHIENMLKTEHPLASTTILTLLTRLSERGFIEIIRQGRGNVYRPLVSKREYLAVQSSSFFRKLCGGSVSAFAAALCDSDLSGEDIEELRRLLERGEL